MENNVNTNNNFGDVFKKGCLVSLSISTYGGTVKVDKKTVKDRMQTKNVKASKFLLPAKSLADINSAAGSARNWLKMISLPFPIKGAVFVPFDLVEKIDNTLTSKKVEFENAVEDFTGKYEDLIDEIRPDLQAAGLFNENDYPRNINDKFSFSWRFITIDTPGENQYLSPEFIKKEQDKFKDTMKTARDMATAALREEFIGLVNNAVDRLTIKDGEKKKIFKASTIDNFGEFFETFTSRNCFGDKDLQDIVEKVEDIMFGVSPEDMRSDDDFRKEISKSLAKVKTEMDKGLTTSGRKLNLSD